VIFPFKPKYLVSLFALLALCAPRTTVLAHNTGHPSFFEINGKVTVGYPVLATTLSHFPLPQDMAPDTYLVNTPISFAINLAELDVASNIKAKTTFQWQFGDGGESVGVTTRYTYKKPGSYIVSIYAKYENDSPVLIESALLHVLPTTGYRLPKAVITVNGKKSADPLSDPLSFALSSQLLFDSSASESGEEKIVWYWWDAGDGSESRESRFEHTYTGNQKMVFPILRVIDENGFISDTYVEIQNAAGENMEVQPNPAVVRDHWAWGIGILGVIGVVWIFLHRSEKKR